MSRLDGKLYELLADEVCRDLLRRVVASDRPLTQRELVNATGLNSSTISRRMALIEEHGLVHRPSLHSPYEVVFRETVRDLLVLAKELALMLLDRDAGQLRDEAEELRGDPDRAARVRSDGDR